MLNNLSEYLNILIHF